MATKKNDNFIKVFIAVISVLIGVFGHYIIDTYLTSHQAEATAETVNGIYVFLKSSPIPNSYTPLGEVATNPFERTVQSGRGKKGGEAFLGVMQSLFSEVSFNNRVAKIVQLAIEEYPEVQGVRFNTDLTSCEAIKFNR